MCEPGSTFVSVKEAATFLETTEMRILMMLKKKELTGKMEDEQWCVDRASLKNCRPPQAAHVVRQGWCGGGCGGGCGGQERM